MSILIAVSECGVIEKSGVRDILSAICSYASVDQAEWLLIPQPGRLMDLLNVLNENNIAYYVQGLAPSADAGCRLSDTCFNPDVAAII